MKIVYISGEMHSGKDTAAKALLNGNTTGRRYTKFSFARLLKDMCFMLMDRCGFDCEEGMFDDQEKKEKVITQDGAQVLFTISRPDGSKYTRTLTRRRLLQLVGTDCFRNVIDESIWARPLVAVAKSVMNYPPAERGIVITDTRYENEFEDGRRLVKAGLPEAEVSHVLIGLKRPAQEEKPQVYAAHTSETSVAQVLAHPACNVVGNDGTIEELHSIIRDIVDHGKAT